MPVRVQKRSDGRYVVVEAKGGTKTPSSGTFNSRGEAQAQANAINMSLKKKGKI